METSVCTMHLVGIVAVENKIHWQAKCNKCQHVVMGSESYKGLTEIAKEIGVCPNCGVDLKQEEKEHEKCMC